jgi:hypothetical protein
MVSPATATLERDSGTLTEAEMSVTSPSRSIVRTLLLATSAAWFLLAAFMRVQDDSVVGLIGIVQRLAFGFAVFSVALIDWQRFRWWWLVVALVAIALVWTATGHPLLFGFGFI